LHRRPFAQQAAPEHVYEFDRQVARFLDPHPVRIGRLQPKITLPTASGNADDKYDLLVNTAHTPIPVEAVRKSGRPYVENTRWSIEEAKAALADPEQREVPVLTIAMDAGFQSVGHSTVPSGQPPI
jgi:hypothetical protein